MLRHTMTYVKGPRTISHKESDHIRHGQHATKKSKANAVAGVTAKVAADSEAGRTRAERLRRMWWAR